MSNLIEARRMLMLGDAMIFLEDMLYDEIRSKYNCVLKAVLLEDNNDSDVSYELTDDILFRERSHPNMHCRIGIKEMIANCGSDRHVRDVYQNDLSGRNLDSARMDAISVLFNGYKTQMYRYMPSEIDADIQGFENTVKWFDKIA